MFGRKQKNPSVTIQEPELLEDEPIEEEVPSITKPIKPLGVKKPEIKKEAQILSGELVSEGLYRYVIVSNVIIGEVGSTFEWRD